MRVFFALWPPMEATDRLAEIAQMAARQYGGRPTRQESMHLTLAFLGELAEEHLPVLIRTAQRVQVPPFVLDINCLGYWHHNRLLWAGQATPCAALVEVVEQLQLALSEAGFAVDGRGRTFAPHITLIRKLPEPRAPLALPAIEKISWSCSSFALVSSQATDAGSLYQTLCDFPFNQS